MAGILGMAHNQEQRAVSNFSRLADMEREREQLGDSLETAEDNQRMQTAMAGAGIGTAIMPGVGTAAGLAAGYALAYFL